MTVSGFVVETPWDGLAQLETCETTDDRPWRTLDGRWLTTAELRPGMLLSRETGMPARVLAVADTGRVQATYNLEVADFHTYFVGEERVWVHNCNRQVDIKTRPTPGRSDGATSRHLVERVNGRTNSVTHQVTDRNGNIIHQHQTHIGTYGTRRDFPDQWVENPSIGH